MNRITETKSLKRLILILSASLALIIIMTCAAFAENGTVKYLDKDGQEVTYTGEYEKIDNDVNPLGENGKTWYVASGTVEYGSTERIEVRGNVNLILLNGAKINAKCGIRVCDGCSLNIYAQSKEQNTMGELIADGSGGNKCAGLGGNPGGGDAFSVTINGGKIIAWGAKYAAGIGGADEKSFSNITINGGIVEAHGGDYGAGIGGGDEANNGTSFIAINGGTVKAYGGQEAAGIGTGNESTAGTITINGGNIEASGGKYGSGIGGGDTSNAGIINITGGTITSTGGDGGPYAAGAGIGGGSYGNAGRITISGGDITARGKRMGAGIGSGGGNDSSSRKHTENGCDGGAVIISGGTVRASGRNDFNGLNPGTDGGAGIGSGAKSFGCYVEITGGNIEAYTSGYNTRTAGYSEKIPADCGSGIGNGYAAESPGEVRISNSDKNMSIRVYTVPDSSEGDIYSRQAAIGAAPDSNSCDVVFECSDHKVTKYHNYQVIHRSSTVVGKNVRLDAIKGTENIIIEPCDHKNSKYDKTENKHNIVCDYCSHNAPEDHKFGSYISHDTYHQLNCLVCGYSKKEDHSFTEAGNNCKCGKHACTVGFDANGATGSMTDEQVADYSYYTLPGPGDSKFKFTPPTGQSFLGWMVCDNMKTPIEDKLYSAGERITIRSDCTLKAMWGMTWSDLNKSVQNAASATSGTAKTVKLNGDVVAGDSDTAILINKGSVTIDLNGHTIDRNAPSRYGEVFIIGNNGNLTIDDTSSNNNGKICGGYSTNSKNGAGVYQIQHGGAVTINSGGSFELRKGTITGNRSTHGGAILVNGGGSFTMTGGSITQNNASFDGGAIYLKSSGTVNLRGGKITSNEQGSEYNGGGIYVEHGSTLNISGSPVVTGNGYSSLFSRTDNNVYLETGSKITLDNNLLSDAKIGISVQDNWDVSETLTTALPAHGSLNNFSSDSNEYILGVNVKGELFIGSNTSENKVTVSFDKNDNNASGKMSSITVLRGSTISLPACGFTPPANRMFGGWLINDSTKPEAATTPYRVDTDITLKCRWIDKPTTAVGISVSNTENGEVYLEKTSVEFNDTVTEESVKIQAVPANGYRFKKWTVSQANPDQSVNASVDKQDSENSVLKIAKEGTNGDILLTAEFEQIAVTGIVLNETQIDMTDAEDPYQLSGSLEPAGAIGTIKWTSSNEDVATVDSSGLVTKKGTGEAVITAAVSSVTASCNVVIDPKYTVTFNSDEGTAVENAIVRVNRTLNRPEDPTKNGYNFAGWRLVQGDTIDAANYDFNTPVTADIILKAVWECAHSNMTEHKEISPSCTERGNSAFWYCENCKKYFADNEGTSEIAQNSWIIPAYGHDWGEWKYVDQNQHKRTCIRDGSHTETASHNMDSGYLIQEPTAAKPGLITYTCIDCNYHKTETIAPLAAGEYIISVSRVGSGEAFADPIKAKTNDEVKLKAVPAKGYLFTGWEIAGAICEDLTSDSVTITIGSRNVKARAIFEKDPDAKEEEGGSGGGGINPDPSGKEDDPVPYPAEQKEFGEDTQLVLSKTVFRYDGWALKPYVKVIDELELTEGKDYTVSYSNDDPRNVGSYTVTVTGINGYKGTLTATYKIIPKGTSIRKPAAGKKSIKVRWKKQSAKMAKTRITGYQIQVAFNKKFTKGKKTYTVKGYKKTAKKISKLKAKKRYYVRIRTYKQVSGK